MLPNTKINADAVLARVLQEGPDGLLTLGEAAALFASRVRDAHDSDRLARNRARMMLKRACEAVGGLPRRLDGRVTVDDIAYLALVKFPGLFNDLPCRPRTVTLSILDGFSAGDSVKHEVTPGDLGECQALVETLRAKLRQLHADHQRAEVERKRELSNRLNGKKEK